MLPILALCVRGLQEARPVNRGRLEHRATVTRTGRSRVAGKTVATSPTTVASSLECWAEAVSPKQRSLLIGKAENARYILSWMDSGPKHEDTVTLTRPDLGESFVLRNVLYDIQGGYWTGTLEEKLS